ncbi:o-succinylbenzoate synthase [Algoriphagus boseongensis]|uniref:O-succinylbenzoate synthase n=1 Tax=Algoriphagus boseongensis TaxID=1442587 RepID=A0A4V3D2P2_9BACT|nr:o-succinylbenzoate synthase [Algoriphagus boseongensis]TDQ19697.1 o-succinylbenzoate synthase [Algoriphagus boseongensis]
MSESVKLQFSFIKRTLQFRFDAGTSRGVLKTRDVYWIKVQDPKNPEVIGWGEAAPLVKLSPDYREDFEEILAQSLAKLSQESWEMEENSLLEKVKSLVSFDLPSLRFGVEMALLDYFNGGKKRFFSNPFFDKNQPIPINGLIWMGDRSFMLEQIDQKLNEGFDCIKMKIGAIDFEQELELLGYIRERYSKKQIVLRVDANGAFSPENVMEKLSRLAQLDIHSIEQPIPAGDWKAMHELCKKTPLPIALDEELIGVQKKSELLDTIQPQHIILKPTLLGGFLETKEWIRLAEERNIGWWMTSALESNIGLNAISQLASSFNTQIPQGLGTGKLYHNNLDSPLEIKSGKIHYNAAKPWENPA